VRCLILVLLECWNVGWRVRVGVGINCSLTKAFDLCLSSRLSNDYPMITIISLCLTDALWFNSLCICRFLRPQANDGSKADEDDKDS
jgi:hypothetical protein